MKLLLLLLAMMGQLAWAAAAADSPVSMQNYSLLSQCKNYSLSLVTMVHFRSVLALPILTETEPPGTVRLKN